MSRPARWLLLVVLLGAPLACSRHPESPAARLRALVTRAETAAEARDLAALKPLISASYTDRSGQNRRAILQLLAYYFLRNESIHLLTRVHEITFPEPGRARMTVLVAMAGRPIPRVQDLAGMRADLYRFDLVAADEGGGDWKVVRAEWRPAELTDFL